LTTIFSFIFTDFLFCLTTTIIDTKYYNKNQFTKFLINFLIFAPLIFGTIFLLLRKRRRPCIAAGFLYLIGGSIVWLYKIAYLIYIIVSDDLDHDYERVYSKMIYLICFLINLLTIFFRLFSCYLIKKYFTEVCKLEEYIHEKEHAIFIQSLATQEGFEGKLCEDDEMDEEKLYSQNNPFISGRDKSDEKEEEEIFQTTL